MRKNVTDRYYRVFTYQPVDRVPDVEFGYWPQTIRRWLKEGLPADFESERNQYFSVKLDNWFGLENEGLTPLVSRMMTEYSLRSRICSSNGGSIPRHKSTGTRDAGYWFTSSDPVYDCIWPDGDIGYWTSMAGVKGAAWIDLPDKQGLLYLTGKAYGAIWYDYGSPDTDRHENWWRVYDPADLAEVAQGNMNHWEPAHDEWPVLEGIPNPAPRYPQVLGMAFDAQSRTLFVLATHVYVYNANRHPAVFGYRIKESWKVGDINHDGYVNVGDLQALVAAWGSQAGPPASSNWNAAADINTDRFVNVGDLQLLVAHWGE